MADIALDHNMDIFIDTQRPLDNHDEIEIDLDVHQAPAEDGDGDVVVDDASATASDHPILLEGVNEYQHDAEMLDEDYTENHRIDAEYSHHSPDGEQQVVEGTYPADTTYEAEMEDEYEEDIDAPIPGSITLELQDSATQEAHYQTTELAVLQPSFDKAESPERDTASRPSSKAGSEAQQPTVAEYKETQEHVHSEERRAEEIKEEHYEDGDAVEDGSPYAEETVLNHPQSDDSGQHVESNEDYENYNRVENRPGSIEDNVDSKTLEATAEDVNLHNIKVLYQDSEISLFPPMEDDPTEMYFLEDTAVAYESISQLLRACRLVLDNHITEQEELVLEIDSLSLRLSENECQESSITLFQIVKLYYSLCSNDGIDEPEPLYLTLTSKYSFESAFNNLLQLAADGKGLSSINRWDEYEQEEAEDGKGLSSINRWDEYEQEEAEDNLIPEESEKGAPQQHADQGTVEKPAREHQEAEAEEAGRDEVEEEPREVAEKPEASSAVQLQEKITSTPADIPPPTEDVDRGNGQDRDNAEDNAAPSTSLEQDAVAEDISPAEGGHSTRGISQPAEAENEEQKGVDHEPEEHESLEGGHSDLAPEETQGISVEEEQSSLVEATEPVQEPDIEAEYSLAADANNFLTDSPHEQDEELEDTAGSQSQLHEAASEHAYEASVADEVSGREDHDYYPFLGTENIENDEHIDIEVEGHKQAETEESAGNSSHDGLDEEIDVSAERDETSEDHRSTETEKVQADRPKVEVTAQAGTPPSSHSILDDEEDIFKSPIVKATIPTGDNPHSDLSLHDTIEEPSHSWIESGNGTERPSHEDLESGEVSADEDDDSRIQSDKGGSPTSVKRPRPADETDALEASVPEFKRRRSG